MKKGMTKDYFHIAATLIKQAETFARLDALRTQIDNSKHLTEEQKEQAHYHCDARESVLRFDMS
jgi:hypothetical protein